MKRFFFEPSCVEMQIRYFAGQGVSHYCRMSYGEGKALDPYLHTHAFRIQYQKAYKSVKR